MGKTGNISLGCKSEDVLFKSRGVGEKWQIPFKTKIWENNVFLLITFFIIKLRVGDISRNV